MTKDELAKYIDHTILRPDATVDRVESECRRARDYGFACVLVHPCMVTVAAGALYGSGVSVGTTCGFPFGQNVTATKVREAQEALRGGASEIDMVLNIAKLKSGLLSEVLADIKAVSDTAKALGMKLVGKEPVVKVIMECGLLSESEKIAVCENIAVTGVDFLKTSTGVLAGGATVEDVELLRRHAPGSISIKASGGIRSLNEGLLLIAAGATRLGTSAGFAICDAAL